MPTSSIDELLLGGGSAPQPKEQVYQESPEPIEEMEDDVSDYGEEEHENDSTESHDPLNNDAEETDSESERPNDKEMDEYGNAKDFDNKKIRERLKRQAESMTKRHQAEIDALRAQLASQGASQQVQQAAKDFEYNPDSDGDWRQQLGQVIRQEVSAMTRDEKQQQIRHEEEKIAVEFRDKFQAGMQKFDDFIEVVDSQPLDEAMTMALRGIADPAAFIYAAAKRNPQELERISKLRDPYARMVEMGKLEERMRKNKPTTQAPRPLGRTTDDSFSPAAKKKTESTIEDLIAKSDAKRLQRVRVQPKTRGR